MGTPVPSDVIPHIRPAAPARRCSHSVIMDGVTSGRLCPELRVVLGYILVTAVHIILSICVYEGLMILAAVHQGFI